MGRGFSLYVIELCCLIIGLCIDDFQYRDFAFIVFFECFLFIFIGLVQGSGTEIHLPEGLLKGYLCRVVWSVILFRLSMAMPICSRAIRLSLRLLPHSNRGMDSLA